MKVEDVIRDVKERLGSFELSAEDRDALILFIQSRYRPPKPKGRREVVLILDYDEALHLCAALDRYEIAHWVDDLQRGQIANLAKLVSLRVGIAFGKWRVDGLKRIDIFDRTISVLRDMRNREIEWNKTATPSTGIWYPEQKQIDEILRAVGAHD